MENAIINLKRKLDLLEQDYILLSTLPSFQAHIKFLGHFEGREIVWNAKILALKHLSNQSEAKGPRHKNSYLEIEEGKNINFKIQEVKLRVALPLDEINISVIRKTMIMVQNYKRLKRGLHYFGNTS